MDPERCVGYRGGLVSLRHGYPPGARFVFEVASAATHLLPIEHLSPLECASLLVAIHARGGGTSCPEIAAQ